MPQHMFFIQMGSTVYDILIWMIWEAKSGEKTVRRLLPWTGVSDPVDIDDAVEALANIEKKGRSVNATGPFAYAASASVACQEMRTEIFKAW